MKEDIAKGTKDISSNPSSTLTSYKQAQMTGVITAELRCPILAFFINYSISMRFEALTGINMQSLSISSDRILKALRMGGVHYNKSDLYTTLYFILSN